MVDVLDFPGSQLSVVKFANQAQMVFPLNQYIDKNSLKQAILDMPHIGMYTTVCFKSNKGFILSSI